MNNVRRSVPPAYFAALYRKDPDPWRMMTSCYELKKYEATIALLPPRQFCNALEIGCSVGVLTRLLAGRAKHVLAIDLDELPLAHARENCHNQGNVVFENMVVPDDWPPGVFDLIVLSEVLYFFDRQDNETLARRVVASAGLDAFVILVNWLGPTDTLCDGDTAADLFIAASEPMFVRCTHRRTAKYRMDLLRALC